jgi:NAD(P)-dependent dehydrogenase (short-subunit alcohol dehydrogenase family)
MPPAIGGTLRHSGQVAHSRLEPHSSGNRRNERSAATADPVPLEQGDAELPLQHPDLLAQRRLRDAEPLGGAGEVQLSSMGGQMSFAGFSAYSATKFALEGLSEALAAEVGPLGIKVLIVEPGAFRTGLFGHASTSAHIADYDTTVGATRTMVAGGDGSQQGDPAKAAAAVVAALDADNTPLRLPLGSDAIDAVLGHLDVVRADITAWEEITRATTFDT